MHYSLVNQQFKKGIPFEKISLAVYTALLFEKNSSYENNFQN